MAIFCGNDSLAVTVALKIVTLINTKLIIFIILLFNFIVPMLYKLLKIVYLGNSIGEFHGNQRAF